MKERVIPKAVLYFTGEILQSGISSEVDESSRNDSMSDDGGVAKVNKHTHFNQDSDSENDSSKNAAGGGVEKPPECDKQVQ